MLEFLKKYRSVVIGTLVLFMAFMVFALNLPRKEHANPAERLVLTATAPLQKGVAVLSSSVSSLWDSYIHLVDLEKENRQLIEQLKRMNSRDIANREAVLENARLKQLLALRDSLQYRGLTARVIGEDGYPWFKTVTIDRGETDGVREGAPVIASAGIVGQIIKVAPTSARVLLFTDQASAIAGTVQRTRARGVVKGKGGARSTLEFTMREDDVKVGDLVVSSGIGRIFPKGLPIGEVHMVKKGEYGIFQQIEIRPAVNLTRLEEVLVLQGE